MPEFPKKPIAVAVEPCSLRKFVWVRAYLDDKIDDPICFTIHEAHGFNRAAAEAACRAKAMRKAAACSKS